MFREHHVFHDDGAGEARDLIREIYYRSPSGCCLADSARDPRACHERAVKLGHPTCARAALLLQAFVPVHRQMIVQSAQRREAA